MQSLHVEVGAVNYYSQKVLRSVCPRVSGCPARGLLGPVVPETSWVGVHCLEPGGARLVSALGRRSFQVATLVSINFFGN